MLKNIKIISKKSNVPTSYPCWVLISPTVLSPRSQIIIIHNQNQFTWFSWTFRTVFNSNLIVVRRNEKSLSWFFFSHFSSQHPAEHSLSIRKEMNHQNQLLMLLFSLLKPSAISADADNSTLTFDGLEI